MTLMVLARRAVIPCFALVWSAPSPLHAQALDASARRFTQGFYDWYAHLVATDTAAQSLKTALVNKSYPIAPELVHALEQDYAASARNADEVVGLDFDPFLATQDPCVSYVAGKVTKIADKFRVDVYAVCNRIKSKKPAVIAQLSRRKERWVFVNFIYPTENGDLLSVLKSLRDARQKAR